MGMLNQLLGGGGDKIGFAANNFNSIVVGPTATAQIQIANDGDVDGTVSSNSVVDRDDWIAPKFNMALYEVRATLQTGGPMSTGTMGSYLSLGTTRTWTLAQLPTGSISATVLFEFRRIGGTFIEFSKVVSFQATSS